MRTSAKFPDLFWRIGQSSPYFTRNTGEVSRAGNNIKSSIKHPMIVTAESSPKEAIGLKFEKKKMAKVAARATLA